MHSISIGKAYLGHIMHYEITVVEDEDEKTSYEELAELCSELRRGPRLKSLRIKTALISMNLNSDGDRTKGSRHKFLNAFSALFDHADKLVAGSLTRGHGGVLELDYDNYHRLKGVLSGPARWTVRPAFGRKKG